MHKAQEDALARTAAENEISDIIEYGANIGGEQARAITLELLGKFPAIQFETTVSKARGAEVALRRLIITGQWEVGRNAK